mgnify:CR=1 FL=1
MIYTLKSDFLLCLEFNIYLSERAQRVEGAEEILPVTVTEGILSRRENLIEVGRTGRESPRLHLSIHHPISLIFDLQSD